MRNEFKEQFLAIYDDELIKKRLLAGSALLAIFTFFVVFVTFKFDYRTLGEVISCIAIILVITALILCLIVKKIRILCHIYDCIVWFYLSVISIIAGFICYLSVKDSIFIVSIIILVLYFLEAVIIAFWLRSNILYNHKIRTISQKAQLSIILSGSFIIYAIVHAIGINDFTFGIVLLILGLCFEYFAWYSFWQFYYKKKLNVVPQKKKRR